MGLFGMGHDAMMKALFEGFIYGRIPCASTGSGIIFYSGYSLNLEDKPRRLSTTGAHWYPSVLAHM